MLSICGSFNCLFCFRSDSVDDKLGNLSTTRPSNELKGGSFGPCLFHLLSCLTNLCVVNGWSTSIDLARPKWEASSLKTSPYSSSKAKALIPWPLNFNRGRIHSSKWCTKAGFFSKKSKVVFWPWTEDLSCGSKVLMNLYPEPTSPPIAYFRFGISPSGVAPGLLVLFHSANRICAPSTFAKNAAILLGSFIILLYLFPLLFIILSKAFSNQSNSRLSSVDKYGIDCKYSARWLFHCFLCPVSPNPELARLWRLGLNRPPTKPPLCNLCGL